jgi:transposase
LTNYVEDLFIEALDMKYHGALRKESQIADQLADGLTEAEVAIMVGTSERNVRRAVKKFREEAEDGED